MNEPVPLPGSGSGSTVTMPSLGLGVYQLRGEECFAACLAGLEAGYRHVDTAQLYGNEGEVGRAVGVGGVKREDLFLTTKVGQWDGDGEKMYESVSRSVMRIAGEKEGGYVDLILVHRPVARWRDIWSVLGRFVREGRARAIGVSNFGIEALEEMRKGCEGVLPCVNQIELHPWCQQRELVAYCQQNGIVVQAYSPLARGQRWTDPVLKEVVERGTVTPAKVLIRWSLQRGFVPLPKSAGVERIRENGDVFWFELDEAEMDLLDGLDLGAAGALFPKNVS
ncbi:putative aldo-keto reductase [Colletotrichum acutatum]|uniref:Aldo-keto reductase n=1 Tax=Glomerella acutata TaxID=27357 RepID=A0AAD8XA55_GLOAC|nr:putative aldo-keto reductase [Colletotrichum acutatum]KAK1713759.1 putative aldo-keto reductase [Colletotrichum acutatum]